MYSKFEYKNDLTDDIDICYMNTIRRPQTGTMAAPVASKKFTIQRIPLQKGTVLYIPNFLSKEEADALYEFTKTNIPFKEHMVRVYGKLLPQPRLSCMLGQSYRYSGTTLEADGEIPEQFHPIIKRLNEMFVEIGEPQQGQINGVLCNRYADGTKYISPHSDDEKDIVPDSYICGLSLGATRHFDLRDKSAEEPRVRVDLTHGSMICMGKGVQKNYTHGVPKELTVKQPRENYTFRWMHEKK